MYMPHVVQWAVKDLKSQNVPNLTHQIFIEGAAHIHHQWNVRSMFSHLC